MNITSTTQKLVYEICKGLTGRYRDEDHRDLAHDVFIKLLGVPDDKETSDAYIRTVCYNVWRDKLAYKSVRKDTFLFYDSVTALTAKTLENLDDTINHMFPTLPTQETDVLVKEANINIHDWPTYHKPQGLARLEIYNNLFK